MIFTTQEFTLTLDTGITVTSASTARILYKGPRGVSGYWDAATTTTKLTYVVNTTDIAEQGKWEFQAYVIIGGVESYGDIAKQQFLNPLN